MLQNWELPDQAQRSPGPSGPEPRKSPKGCPAPGNPRVPKESTTESEKSPKRVRSCVFGLFSDSVADSLGTLGLPGAGHPFGLFSDSFGVLGPQGPGDLCAWPEGSQLQNTKTPQALRCREVLHGVSADGVGVKFPVFAVNCCCLPLSFRRSREKRRKRGKMRSRKRGKIRKKRGKSLRPHLQRPQ